MKIAAIDIGSNAARLLIVDVTANKQKVIEFQNINFLRLPLRLGFDVFETGEIGKLKEQKIVNAMQAFKNLVDFYDVEHLKVCATSALREARNNQEIIKTVETQTGIAIKIISGEEEAILVNETHIAENMNSEHGYIYINVGGGSTELVVFINGKVTYTKSIDIGTIKILKNLVSESQWDNIKTDLKTHVKSQFPLVAIGSGGNINKIFSISKKKEGKPLSLNLLEEFYQDLNSLSLEERMRAYKFRQDRADVIVPALQIFIKLMRWTGINEMYVPKIGLVDGLVHALYEEVMANLKLG